ncbi:hypothetical protein C0Z20_22570 [Trinickia symbiotica]|uniref:Uncharacterized protein n=1 Tax=Trinickia symbiotica TaxID=863227 RepID=A0A2N7WYT3_9BURK|nr:hypothetical protein C0Z20_22570 [Trinickia symbiotica]
MRRAGAHASNARATEIAPLRSRGLHWRSPDACRHLPCLAGVVALKAFAARSGSHHICKE